MVKNTESREDQIARDKRYSRVRGIVYLNAMTQAKGDAESYPGHRIYDAVCDPFVYEEAVGVLRSWAQGPRSNLVFVRCTQTDVELLSPLERNELIEYWIDQYLRLVFGKLRERLERESV